MKFINKSNYYVVKKMNNNCLLITDNTTEMIVISKGISFRYKLNEKISENELFEKKYTLIKEKAINAEYDNIDLFKKATNILEIVNRELKNKEIEPEVMKAFFSHCVAMIRRIENSNEIMNPFHYETIALYKDSYHLTEVIAQ
ncbi:CAT RNA binding domain-containing protein, partial [Carnobacterium sp.]|uniref:CAT RNA binding domain-containing protein n=1 Tax=Carnobacterium sp. TaxID=48221 RepID=UPI0028AC120F